MVATGWQQTEITARIMKGLWSPTGTKPKWADLARKRGWMTLAAYLKVPFEPGGGYKELLFQEHPFFRAIPKARVA